MKTARDYYPDIDNDLFQKATDWMCETYSYVPYMEPARNGYINGHAAQDEKIKPLITQNEKMRKALEFYAEMKHAYLGKLSHNDCSPWEFKDGLDGEVDCVMMFGRLARQTLKEIGGQDV